MRRPITLLGFALLALACACPAEAQMFGGTAGNIAEDLAKEGKDQLARAKKYTASPSTRGYMSAARSSANHGSVISGGRVDMSGHVPPSYYQLRDQSPLVSRRGYSPIASRRAAPRSSYQPRAAVAPSATSRRRAPLGDIPPAPR